MYVTVRQKSYQAGWHDGIVNFLEFTLNLKREGRKMIVDKSCPGSRTIREPRPESMACPNCGKEIDGGDGERMSRLEWSRSD